MSYWGCSYTALQPAASAQALHLAPSASGRQAGRQVAAADVSCIHNSHRYLLVGPFSPTLMNAFAANLFLWKPNRSCQKRWGATEVLQMMNEGKRWGRQMNRDSHRGSWCNHGYLYFMDGVILAGVGSEGQISSRLHCTHNLFLNICHVDERSVTVVRHVNRVKYSP